VILGSDIGSQCRSLLAGDFRGLCRRSSHRLQAGSYIKHYGVTALALIIIGAYTDTRAVAAPPAKIISVWTSADLDKLAVLKKASETFNCSQQTYRVELFPSLYRNYDERVINAALTGTLPSLVEFDGPFLHAFAWRGYLLPLDKFVPAELLNDLLPSVIAQGTYRGRLYSLGQFDSGLALWGNRRYLSAAGVRIPTITNPWTLAEFEQAMDKLTALDEVEYALNLELFSGATEYFSYALAPILQGFGGDLIDRTTYRTSRGVLDGPQSVAAMKRFYSWFQRGWTVPVFDRYDDFVKGKAALSLSGHWQYKNYNKALGEDLVLMPMPNFGHGITTGMGSWNWGISSTCRYPKGAWAFLAYLLTAKEVLRMTDATGAIPALKSALAQSSLYGPSGPMEVFVQQLESGFGVPRPRTPAYGTLTRVWERAVRAIIAGGDIQSELTKAAELIDREIDANQGYP
jgi:multiple sugar transport system substrate-binding protein